MSVSAPSPKSSVFLNALGDIHIRIRLPVIAGAAAGAEDVQDRHGRCGSEQQPRSFRRISPPTHAISAIADTKRIPTYHSNAPNTVAAFAAEHTLPKHTRPVRKTASAMKPANQKSVVTDSAARMANLWCAMVSEKRQGTRMR